MRVLSKMLLATVAALVTTLLWAGNGPLFLQSPKAFSVLEVPEVVRPVDSPESAYPGAPVERTGQGTCFSADGDLLPCRGTGQDGELRPGILWPESRFSDVGDGTVLDQLNGLTWLQDGGCLGAANWEQALVKVQNLNAGTDFGCSNYTAGMWSDWRLPNIKEAVSLLDYSAYDPGLPTGHPFVNVGPNLWSSTTDLGTPSRAYTLHLGGVAYLAEGKSNTFGVWAVRGGPSADFPDAVEKTGQTTCYNASGTLISCVGTGQDGELQIGVEWPSPRFTDRGDGTVSDELSGNVWLQDTGCRGSSNWAEALKSVHELGRGVNFDCTDHTPSVRLGWRLPTVRDLISLLDFGQTDPAFPMGHPFTGPASSIFWTSSNYYAPSGADKAYSVRWIRRWLHARRNPPTSRLRLISRRM